jgi:thiol peroxidase
MQERNGAVTLDGNPMTLIGPELKVGDKAPEFKLIGTDVRTVTLAETAGKVRLLASVFSLDTPVCDGEMRRFSKELGKLDGVELLVVSMDLPAAQGRWCGGTGLGNARALSDYRDRAFGPAYGVLIQEVMLHSRAVFVIDKNDMIRYAEYVKEVGDQPDFEAALAAAQGLAL